MNTITKVILATTLFSATSFSYANDYKTTIEYRHEYRDGTNRHGDRIKAFLDTGKNIGFELDARYNNDQLNTMFDGMTMNGSEFAAFYYKKLTDNIMGIGGLSLDFTPDGLVYVPYARLNYRFDNGIRLQGRYKWKFWDYNQQNINKENYVSKIQEVDFWLGYNTNNWDYQYEFQIWKEMEGNALPQFDNKDTNYLHNFRLMYTYKTAEGTMWRPFVEVGNVSQSRYTDNRQTRYRMGIKYTW
ncbi:oligogalacturonate-specific porin KdgM family protein [Photobacterium phosphoreum]|uniref:oligogalacturonate-specific porin KdgM family protein n=1 Tax=Photobacterium phosphoreum TaxID=659 RepID=UPI0007F8EE22|nr:oligogalacturonate-specific porin KdgM family protein [Photobacterium phosphoreum]MCD9502943.1 hypothetical protein [Photobacterium phosphoreum]OBU28469.1 hypothetical protein AYY24_08460 [Photobacterium phosphoreum]PSU81564.1 hypothetical protein CTM93_15200 [Photobacterium phosphoreum]PSW38504.1 hypothetical protein CTM87_02440 [Photobacterium phosphoreum]PSW43317.1 hypothetical protein CTM70_03675 [Photobacterium phosphoreum]